MKASFSEDLECCTAHEEIPISRAASVSIREDVDVYHELLVLLQNQAKDKFVSDEKFLEKNRYHQKKTTLRTNSRSTLSGTEAGQDGLRKLLSESTSFCFFSFFFSPEKIDIRLYYAI